MSERREEDLREVLGRAAGAPGPRPPLAGLWAEGRARRRRTRVLASAAAVLAVLALVAGALALAASDDGQDVVAGPAGPPAGAPPTELTDLPVTIELAAGPVVDGLPAARPGEPMTATYVGTGGYGRDAVAAWERWDGAIWVPEHTLVVERAGAPGSGQVLPAGAVVDSGELRFEEEVDTYPTPDDLVAGWYRVCVPMHQYSGVGPTTPEGATATDPAGTVPGDVEPPGTYVPDTTTSSVSTAPAAATTEPAPTTTTPAASTTVTTTEPVTTVTTTEPAGGSAPATEPPFGTPIRPCAQLRVVADVPATTTTEVSGTTPPPPAEPRPADLTLSVPGTPPYPPGGSIAVQVLHAGGIELGFDTSWEQWDGDGWVRSHMVLGAPYDGVEPAVVPFGSVAWRTGTVTSEEDVTPLVVVIPPAAELWSPWSRVCIDARPAEPGRRPCVQVAVDGAGGRSPTVHGDQATWTVDPQRPPSPEDTRVTVLVTRMGCSGGTTGALLEPRVERRTDEVVITVDAVPEAGAHTCPGNDAVPVTVEVGGPIGDRDLVDGWCTGSASPNPCEGTGEVRWSPS